MHGLLKAGFILHTVFTQWYNRKHSIVFFYFVNKFRIGKKYEIRSLISSKRPFRGIGAQGRRTHLSSYGEQHFD